jgi:hypothetical protein
MGGVVGEEAVNRVFGSLFVYLSFNFLAGPKPAPGIYFQILTAANEAYRRNTVGGMDRMVTQENIQQNLFYCEHRSV